MQTTRKHIILNTNTQTHTLTLNIIQLLSKQKSRAYRVGGTFTFDLKDVSRSFKNSFVHQWIFLFGKNMGAIMRL